MSQQHPANSDAEFENEGQELEKDDNEDDDNDDDDDDGEEEDEEEDKRESDVDPSEEQLSAHTKSLIAHLASLPGFGQTRGRISYVPYSGPEPTGTTLAELQLPWRSSTSMGHEETSFGEFFASSSPSTKVNSSASMGVQLAAGSTARKDSSTVKLRSKTVSLDRRRGTNTNDAWLRKLNAELLYSQFGLLED